MKKNVAVRIFSLVMGLAIIAFVICACSGAPKEPQDTAPAYGWGDSDGGRQSLTLDQINHGELGNKIVFNVLSDGPIGDEKNFVGARRVTGKNEGVNNVWNGDTIEAEDGQRYLIRAYVDNCNPNGLNAVSEGTRVAFYIPEESGTELAVNGFIFSDNASPAEYWDGVCFYSDTPIHLEYEYGSAKMENNGIGANGGVQLGDEIVTKAHSENGILIGYEKLDGRIAGGSTYDAYISIKVTVVFEG